MKKKHNGFSSKMTNIFKITKGGKITAESVSNDNISQKCFLHFSCEVFFGGNLENMMKKESIGEKTLSFFKRHFYKNGKAENQPVVAGRLVSLLIILKVIAFFGERLQLEKVSLET